MSWAWGGAAHGREHATGHMSGTGAEGARLGLPHWLPPLPPASGSRPSGGEADADGMRTVWTRAQARRDRGPTRCDGGPAAPDSESVTSIGPGSPGPISASSSEASTSAAQPEAARTGSRVTRSTARPATTASTVPASRSSRRGQSRGGVGRRAPKRCKRCGRFLRKESWIRSLTRTVSKSLTHVPWGRRRECATCFRPFRRVRMRLGRPRGKVKMSRRGRSKSRKRGRAPRPRSRSNNRNQKGRSNKRRRRRRSIDDQKFFVC